MATLKDVARLACVDVSTVSRALNNSQYVHPDTKARVYAAAKELGYHPNVIAQALRQGKRHTIGAVVPRLHLATFSEILQGIELGARRLGYTTLICNTDDDPKVEKERLDRLRGGFVDGLTIAATGKNGRLLRDIEASGIAVVQVVRRQDERISSIVADYEACGRDAVRYLYGRGCRTIGFINGSLEIVPYRGRYEGYSKAIRELGLEEILSNADCPFHSFEFGYQCACQLLDEMPGLDGILASMDIQGLGAIRAARERGLKIPDQIKVMSLSGHAVGGMLETTMTSMEMPAREMGEKAARMVIDAIEASSDAKPSVQRLVFPASLVVREST